MNIEKDILPADKPALRCKFFQQIQLVLISMFDQSKNQPMALSLYQLEHNRKGFQNTHQFIQTSQESNLLEQHRKNDIKFFKLINFIQLKSELKACQSQIKLMTFNLVNKKYSPENEVEAKE